MRHLLGVLALAWASPAIASSSTQLSTPAPDSTSGVQQEWSDLQSRAGKSLRASETADWADIAAKARLFRARYPQSAQAGESRKLEISALIKAAKEGAANTLDSQVESFLKDTSIPVGDRFDIAVLAKASANKRATKNRSLDGSALREHDARDLLSRFPDEPRCYGYLLLVAQGEQGPARVRLAREVLNSPASERVKETARRTLAQQNLLGKQFSVSGVDISKYKGKPLLVYTWSAQRADILKAAAFWSQIEGVVLLGVNLDDDATKAKTLASTLSIPGDQLYAGGGLDGPIARQIAAKSLPSVYLVDQAGVLVDVDGHRNTLEKMRGLLVTEGKK